MPRQTLVLGFLVLSPAFAPGAPPAAIVQAKLSVPDSLRYGTFATDRYLN